jgi:DNA polymerase III subunit epsilon
MIVLVFDTETTGLPENRNTSIFETDKWPYIVQLTYLLYDTEGNHVLEMEDMIIKCDIDIPEEATNIHGITNNISMIRGIEIDKALDVFDKALKKADVVVGHNISFDKRLYMVETIRRKRRQYFTVNKEKKEEYCTMKQGKDVCKIEKVSYKGDKYYKYPTLTELYYSLFKKTPEGVHNAFNDVLACFRCYYKMTQNKDVLDMNYGLKEIYNLHLD